MERVYICMYICIYQNGKKHTNPLNPKTMTTQNQEIIRINDQEWNYADFGMSLVASFCYCFANNLRQVGEAIITFENGVKIHTIPVASK